jgi:hypothetical protein
MINPREVKLYILIVLISIATVLILVVALHRISN